MAVNSYREDEFMENTDKKKIFRRLFSYLLDYKAILIGVLLCMAVTVAISLVNPLLIEEAIDHYIANKDMRGLMGLGLFALGLNIIFIIMVKIRKFIFTIGINCHELSSPFPLYKPFHPCRSPALSSTLLVPALLQGRLQKFSFAAPARAASPPSLYGIRRIPAVRLLSAARCWCRLSCRGAAHC